MVTWYADERGSDTDNDGSEEIPQEIRFDPCTIYGGCTGTRTAKSVASTNPL